tara:strand:+ start:6335 stop:6592 length:258 start_codon:yes stop_codon:yes gene_type:complete
MSKRPYPGYAPNYQHVDELGGFRRSCFIIDILSLENLSSVQIAIIQEQIEAAMSTISNNMHDIERSEVVSPDRFDRSLKDGLRLS